MRFIKGLADEDRAIVIDGEVSYVVAWKGVICRFVCVCGFDL